MVDTSRAHLVSPKTLGLKGTFLLLVVLALGFSLLGAPSSAQEQTTDPDPVSAHGLRVSTAADRSGASNLDGATVAGNIHVFTAPDAGVSQVAFWLDDPGMTVAPTRVEKGAPFDLAGGTTSAANPLDTTKLPDGQHSITAKLTLADGATSVINGAFTVANASTAPAGAFQGQNGSVVMEIESAPLAGKWALETEKPDYTGAGYYAWRGGNNFGTPGRGVLAYEFVADRGGVYKMNIRNRRDKDGRTVANDQENDVWARMDGGAWTKVFSGTPFGEWGWGTKFDLGGGIKPNASYDLAEGMHTLELSGRSANFKLDRIHLRVEGLPSTTLPESSRVGG